MKICKVSVYRVLQPLVMGRYAWSNGLYIEESDATVVEIQTDNGLAGLAEITPLGPAYIPSFAEGARAGLSQLAPALIGEDPTNLSRINRIMDLTLAGHPYAKSPVDIACWDILGQAAGLPVYQLLGGRMQDTLKSFTAISQSDPETMATGIQRSRERGIQTFQLKVGGDVDDDINRIRACHGALGDGDVLYADANTGWTVFEAVRVLNSISDLKNVFIEQPCKTYEECFAVRQRTNLPFILDESIDTVQTMMRAINERACDAINLKVSRVGGLTKAKQIRDLCVSNGIAVNVDEALSGNINSAVLSHIAASTPEDALLATVLVGMGVTVKLVDGGPWFENGRIHLNDAPGLGVSPNRELLGEPVLEFT